MKLWFGNSEVHKTGGLGVLQLLFVCLFVFSDLNSARKNSTKICIRKSYLTFFAVLFNIEANSQDMRELFHEAKCVHHQCFVCD